MPKKKATIRRIGISLQEEDIKRLDWIREYGFLNVSAAIRIGLQMLEKHLNQILQEGKDNKNEQA